MFQQSSHTILQTIFHIEISISAINDALSVQYTGSEPDLWIHTVTLKNGHLSIYNISVDMDYFLENAAFAVHYYYHKGKRLCDNEWCRLLYKQPVILFVTINTDILYLIVEHIVVWYTFVIRKVDIVIVLL